ncbi:MAG: YfbR-like 5'-deoxynucleotidase [Candidatus Paceibacterota bacterium]|jgi:5'-deoxynucleotidase YfbR-like HD superfamily hydrolase
MELSDATKILEFVSNFQTKAQAIKRYEGNPYVEGDNIAEHLSRVARLLICIAPDLKKEFPNEPALIEETLVCLLVHDDDEVIDGFDIPAPIKSHNSKDDEEIEKFKEHVSKLTKETRDLLTSTFGSFRKKDTLFAKIAKVLDNISGNQLVIEQKIGLISPDQAKFAIEYAQKVKGVSKITDYIIDAQVAQIVEYRDYLKSNPDELNKINGVSEFIEKAKELLQIDVLSHSLDKNKIFTPLNQL